MKGVMSRNPIAPFPSSHWEVTPTGGRVTLYTTVLHLSYHLFFWKAFHDLFFWMKSPNTTQLEFCFLLCQTNCQ